MSTATATEPQPQAEELASELGVIIGGLRFIEVPGAGSGNRQLLSADSVDMITAEIKEKWERGPRHEVCTMRIAATPAMPGGSTPTLTLALRLDALVEALLAAGANMLIVGQGESRIALNLGNLRGVDEGAVVQFKSGLRMQLPWTLAQVAGVIRERGQIAVADTSQDELPPKDVAAVKVDWRAGKM